MTAICWERLDRKHRLVMYGWKQLSLHVLLSFVNSYMCMCVAFVIHPFIPVWKHLYMGELKPIYSPFKPSFMWSWMITEWKGHETMKGSCKLWILNYQVPDSELSDTGLWVVRHWTLSCQTLDFEPSNTGTWQMKGINLGFVSLKFHLS